MRKVSAGTVALIDAFRAEVAETRPEGIVNVARLGVRLTPSTLAAFDGRIEALVRDLKDADDPAGEPFGFLVGLHRREE